MLPQQRLQLIPYAISAIAFFSFSEWIATTRIGTSHFLWCQAFYLFPLLAAVPMLPVMLVMVCFRGRRARVTPWLLSSLLFIPCCALGIYLGHLTRMAGMDACGQRAQPLIAAIQRYEQDQGQPPSTLADLVPKYLPSAPWTGMMAYPNFEYVSGTQAEQNYDGNPWILAIQTPGGGINFDQLLYFPKQNYPDSGYGGSLQRLGSWAYVHE